MSTELVQVTKALADMDAVSVGLAALRDKFGGVVFEVSTTQGMTEAKAARAAIRDPRYSVELIRKEAKAPILALGKKLDAEAKRITDELLKIENPIQEQIAAEESRKEREREAKVAAELKRVTDLQSLITTYRNVGTTLSASSGSKTIAEVLADFEAQPTDESFQELQQQAIDAKGASLKRLQDLHAAALAQEEEQIRIAAEREELARLRAEQARRDAEDRARREAEEREARKAREAEEARAAEQRRLQKEQDDREAADRRRILAEQEAAAKQAREAEAARQQKDREAHEAHMRRERDEQEKLAQANRDHIAEEERRAAAIRAEEQARINAERAQLAREQEAARKAAEPAAPTRMRPKADDLVTVIASHFKVTPEVALRWLRSTDFGKAQDAA